MLACRPRIHTPQHHQRRMLHICVRARSRMCVFAGIIATTCPVRACVCLCACLYACTSVSVVRACARACVFVCMNVCVNVGLGGDLLHRTPLSTVNVAACVFAHTKKENCLCLPCLRPRVDMCVCVRERLCACVCLGESYFSICNCIFMDVCIQIMSIYRG